MLISEDLKELIISKIFGKTSALEAQTALASALSEYLLENLEMRGTYQGTIPSVPPIPDPLNGSSITFKLLSLPIIPTSLASAANSGGFTAWTNMLNVILKNGDFNPSGTVEGSPAVVCTLTPSFKSLGITLDLDISGDNFESIMSLLASQIVTSIKNSSCVYPTLPVTTVNSGVGVVTLEGKYI